MLITLDTDWDKLIQYINSEPIQMFGNQSVVFTILDRIMLRLHYQMAVYSYLVIHMFEVKPRYSETVPVHSSQDCFISDTGNSVL